MLEFIPIKRIRIQRYTKSWKLFKAVEKSQKKTSRNAAFASFKKVNSESFHIYPTRYVSLTQLKICQKEEKCVKNVTGGK